MSTVGDGLSAGNANWKFSSQVAENFDLHARKSIPEYTKGHRLIRNLSDFFIGSNSICYEIGCSTGTLTYELSRQSINKTGARFIGIDIEKEMIQAATEKKDPCTKNVEFIHDDIEHTWMNEKSGLLMLVLGTLIWGFGDLIGIL